MKHKLRTACIERHFVFILNLKFASRQSLGMMWVRIYNLSRTVWQSLRLSRLKLPRLTWQTSRPEMHLNPPPRRARWLSTVLNICWYCCCLTWVTQLRLIRRRNNVHPKNRKETLQVDFTAVKNEFTLSTTKKKKKIKKREKKRRKKERKRRIKRTDNKSEKEEEKN